MTLEQVFQLLADPSKLGVLGLMAVIIMAILKGWVVTATHHLEIVTEKDKYIAQLEREKEEFKQIALRGTELAQRALTASEKIVEKRK
jgi:cell division protein FtsL